MSPNHWQPIVGARRRRLWRAARATRVTNAVARKRCSSWLPRLLRSRRLESSDAPELACVEVAANCPSYGTANTTVHCEVSALQIAMNQRLPAVAVWAARRSLGASGCGHAPKRKEIRWQRRSRDLPRIRLDRSVTTPLGMNCPEVGGLHHRYDRIAA